MSKISPILFVILFALASKTTAQISQKTDSIFNQLHLKFSDEALYEAKLEYEMANDTIKAIMLKIYSLPMSSKTELINNYIKNTDYINELKNEFEKSIPQNMAAAIEIKMTDNWLHSIESVDIEVYRKDSEGNLVLIDADWDMNFESEEFNSMLKLIGWDMVTFTGIKNLMQMANCIAINNNDYTEIAYKRSGLGMYSYLFLPTNKPSSLLIKRFNDNCQYKYYKDNLVLKYVGGMAGPQCFTD